MKTKITGRILALLMMLCVLCAGISASAEPLKEDAQGEGSVEITTHPLLAGIELALFEVGSYDNGSYILNDAFKDSNADVSSLKTASETEAAADALAKYSANLTPLAVKAFDDEGKVEFDSLAADNNMYLICQRERDDQFTVSPILVVLPVYVNGDAQTALQIEGKFVQRAPTDIRGAVILTKTDDKNNGLSGAEFRFECKRYVDGESNIGDFPTFEDEDGIYIWEMISDKLVSDKNGQIVVEQLPLGIYRFVETKAPSGFRLDSTPIMAEVFEEGTVRVEKGIYVPDLGSPAMITAVNTPIPDYPPQSSVESSDFPPSSSVAPPQSSITPPPTPSNPPVVTGEDIAKFIIIGVVVAVSLVAVVLLIVLGRKKKDNDDE